MKSDWANEVMPNVEERYLYLERMRRAYVSHGKPVPTRVQWEWRQAVVEIILTNLRRGWRRLVGRLLLRLTY